MPALKRARKVETFPGALKRCFPRMNAGAPTTEHSLNSFTGPAATTPSQLPLHQRYLG
jgi:hypothetical protein